MSVLESMRSGTDSTFMQVVLALVVVSFVFWYAVPQGEQSQVVAVVNGTKIMDTVYLRELRQAQYQAEQRYSRALSNEERAVIGEQVRQQLIEDEVVFQEAEDLGIEVSDREIARAMAQIPAFRTEEGKFDRRLLDRFLKNQGYTQSGFEDEIRRDMTREKLRLLVFTGASVSEPEIKDAWIESNTTVDIKYVKVPARSFTDEVEVSPEQIDQYVTENEPEIQARYERDYQRLYNKPARVTLRMIQMPINDENPVTDVLPKMNELHEQLEGGADFAELAKEHSVDPTAANGGLREPVPVAQLGTEDATALTDVPVGGLTRVFTTPSHARLYKVEERLEAEVIPVDDVKREIAETMIREEGGPALAAAFAEEQLLPAWKEAGEVPQDLLDEHGLSAISTGEIPAQPQPNNFFAPPAALVNAARTAEVGSVFDEVFEQSGTLWVAQLVSRTDPDEALYETEKADLEETVLAQKRSTFFENWVADAKSRASIQSY